MLRPACSLPPRRFSTPRLARRLSTTNRACYRALRCLPGRDFHPQAWTSFQDATCMQHRGAAERLTGPPGCQRSVAASPAPLMTSALPPHYYRVVPGPRDPRHESGVWPGLTGSDGDPHLQKRPGRVGAGPGIRRATPWPRPRRPLRRNTTRLKWCDHEGAGTAKSRCTTQVAARCWRGRADHLRLRE